MSAARDAQSAASKYLKPKPKEEPAMSFADRAAMFMADVDEGGAAGLVAGAKVEAKFGGKGKFYPGKIEAVNADGTFAILFDDGDKEPKALRENVKLVDVSADDALNFDVIAALEAGHSDTREMSEMLDPPDTREMFEMDELMHAPLIGDVSGWRSHSPSPRE